MNKVIWKFEFETNDVVEIQMPKHAEILYLNVQHNPCIWALCNPSAQRETRVFRIYGTGSPISQETPKTYIGSYHLMSGALVFHVFEVKT